MPHSSSRLSVDELSSQWCHVGLSLTLPSPLQDENYSAADAGVIELIDDKERERLRADPLYRLEHGEMAKVKVRGGQGRQEGTGCSKGKALESDEGPYIISPCSADLHFPFNDATHHKMMSRTPNPAVPSFQARTVAEEITDLQDHNDATHRDDYAVNKLLRARLRKAKAEDAGLDAR